jgi:hypothetical protein
MSKDQSTFSGTGMTRDMSSGGLAFHCDAELPVGSPIEIRVSWPAVAEEISQLELRIAGRVVRSAAPDTAVQLQRHHFEATPKSAGEKGDNGFLEERSSRSAFGEMA